MFQFIAAVTIGLVVLIAAWKGVLVVLAVSAALWCLNRSGWARRRRAEAQKRSQARLVARADAQHQAYMSGDLNTALYGTHQPPEVVCDHKFCGGSCK